MWFIIIIAMYVFVIHVFIYEQEDHYCLLVGGQARSIQYCVLPDKASDHYFYAVAGCDCVH